MGLAAGVPGGSAWALTAGLIHQHPAPPHAAVHRIVTGRLPASDIVRYRQAAALAPLPAPGEQSADDLQRLALGAGK